MKVQLERRRGGHKEGATITVSDSIGARMVERGDATEVGSDSNEPPYPDGEPAESWKVGQLKAWAKDNDVELGDATKKDDVWNAVAARVAPSA